MYFKAQMEVLVLDAFGNLVGLNFDRAWEGSMSDVNYNAAI